MSAPVNERVNENELAAVLELDDHDSIRYRLAVEVQQHRALDDRDAAMAIAHAPLEERVLVNIVNGMRDQSDVASSTYTTLALECLRHRAASARVEALIASLRQEGWHSFADDIEAALRSERSGQ